MKLYDSPTSPYVRKVHVLLRETEQLDDVEMITSGGTPLDSGSNPIALNPLGKIPTLERANGATLYDSRVICRFFDDRAGSNLYCTGARHWELCTLEATADGILDAALQITYETRLRPEDIQFADFIEGQWSKIARALDALETRWMSHLSGPINIGQIAVGCALGYLDLRTPDRDWRKSRDSLKAFYAAFEQRPSMQATIPKG
jgi:glutathione S-transferase